MTKFDTVRLKLGEFECTLVNDATVHYPAEGMVPGLPMDELAKWLDPSKPDVVESPWTCMLVDTGTHKVLIDTGGGHHAVAAHPGAGRLVAALSNVGIRTDEIDAVVITHGHPDHAGGAADLETGTTFSSARYVMLGEEWRYWTSRSTLQTLESQGDQFHQQLASSARRCLPPLEPQLELLNREAEIVPGIYALPAPGHTPGHMVVYVESGNDRLLFLADTAVHPMFLENPAWRLVADVDGELASRTRRKVLDMAATEQVLVAAFHFPFPGLGRITGNGDAWRWQPLPSRPVPGT